MGAGFSVFGESETSGIRSSPSLETTKPGLGDLPENCISSIIKYLDPPEICKLAVLNRAFRGASLADFVWESKLPSNYKFLVEKVLQYGTPHYMPKKDIYSKLCQPNRFDGGTKVMSLPHFNNFLFLRSKKEKKNKKNTEVCLIKFRDLPYLQCCLIRVFWTLFLFIYTKMILIKLVVYYQFSLQ